MVPSKTEITLRKADQVAWGKLEDPNYKPEPEPEPEDSSETTESYQPHWDIEDDDISDSDDEWAHDPPQNKLQEEEEDHKLRQDERAKQNLQRKEVEEEMKKAAEERERIEERKRLEEQRRLEEEGGDEDMPELE